MSWLERVFSSRSSGAHRRIEPSFRGLRAVQMGDPVSFDGLADPTFAEYLREGAESSSGSAVTDRTIMMLGVANRCVKIICGILATMPCDLMIKEDEYSRVPAVDDPLRGLLTVKPNRWQTPAEFKEMLSAHVLLRGNGYALKVQSRGLVLELLPLHPERMSVVQNSDLSLTYRYTTLAGAIVGFSQNDIFHLRALSSDGITGRSVLADARESIGLALATRRAASNLYRNGQFTSGFFTSPNRLNDDSIARLQTDLDRRTGVMSEDAAMAMILDDGLKFEANSPSAKDAEFLGTLDLTRTEVAMFFGVPPHMYGDISKQTSYGAGVEQQNIAFLQTTMQRHFTMWAETFKRDCLSGAKADPRLYLGFDLSELLRGDLAAQAAFFGRALGLGGSQPWMTRNEVRSKMNLPRRPEPWADELPQSAPISIDTESQVIAPGAPKGNT